MNNEPIKTFKKTAVAKEGGFEHFDITPNTASIYGHKKEQIVEVTLEISDDQTPDDRLGEDYWGWWDSEEERWVMIYPGRKLLNMCIPYGFEAREEKGLGKAYRLEILED